MATTYRADWVFCYGQEPLRDAILIVEEGKTREVKPWRNEAIDVDLGQVLVTPGFYNAHTHLDLGGLRGRIPPPASFTSWLEAVIQHRRTSDPSDWDQAIQSGINESVASGTKSIGDISVGGRSERYLAQAALSHSRIYLELIGLGADRVEQALLEAQAWIGPRSDIPMHCLSPHAPYTVSRHLLERLVTLAPNTSVAMHVAETREELKLINSRTGPFREFLHKMQVWHPEQLCSSMDELLGILRGFKHLTLVHGNYLTPQQWQRLNTPLTVVYCPRTHAYFGHDPHPYLEMHADGIIVSLGTDSLASNPDLSILEEARFLWRRDRDRLTGGLLLELACGIARSLDHFVVIPHSNESRDPWELLWAGTAAPSAVYQQGRQIHPATPPQ